MKTPHTKHESVLLEESVKGLQLQEGDTAIDATVGAGGHAELVAEMIGKKGTLAVIDADELSLSLAREKLKDAPAKIIFLHGNFRNIKTLAREAGIASADGIVFDLGWHAGQLEGGRGLSFNADEPLDMRLDLAAPKTAADIIKNWHEDELAELFRSYGEERFSGRIARVIVEARKKAPIKTSQELAGIIASAVPAFYRRGRLHPATRTFQALRIAVNDELVALKEGLTDAIELLNEGGRVAVISFHSLEDRIVKTEFRTAEDNGVGKRITKKPLTPSVEERARNPRARSAKLRIFEKTPKTL